MTKQQRSATGLSPSRLCRILFCLFALKLVALGFLTFDPVLPANDGNGTGLLAVAGSLLSFSGGSQAEAATGEAAGASPPVTATLPGGNNAVSPQAPISPSLPPSSTPGGSGQTVLPGIQTVPAPARSGNATEGAGTSMERENLARRQENLARKEQELRILEGELGKKLEQMKMLENRISQMMKDAEGAQDAKFRHLVDVLSNMKSKQAASVLETLDPKIAVKVLAGMRGRQAGEILTFVKPEKAAQLTESLARMQMPLQ